MRIRPVADGDVDAVVTLWGEYGLTRPWNAPHDDIAFTRKTPQCEIFIATNNDAIVASVLLGSDGHGCWIYYLRVDPDRQVDGLGREIMAHGENQLRELGVPKVELMIRPENDAVRPFYERIGYSVEGRIVMSRWVDGREGR